MSTSSHPNAPSDSPLPVLRRRWWPWVIVLVVFVSGGVIGAGTTLLLVRNRALESIHNPENVPTKITRRMRRSLRLSDSQSREIEDILRKRQNNLLRLRQEILPRIHAELDEVDDEISAVLNNKQRERWRRRFTQLRSTWVPPPVQAATENEQIDEI